MHLTEIRIDEIVHSDGLPCHARGRASFTNGREYHFHAMFAQGYEDSRVFVYQHREGGPQYPGGRVARAIHDRLGFTEISARARDAIAAFEYERVTACQALMPRPPRTRRPST